MLYFTTKCLLVKIRKLLALQLIKSWHSSDLHFWLVILNASIHTASIFARFGEVTAIYTPLLFWDKFQETFAPALHFLAQWFTGWQHSKLLMTNRGKYRICQRPDEIGTSSLTQQFQVLKPLVESNLFLITLFNQVCNSGRAEASKVAEIQSLPFALNFQR